MFLFFRKMNEYAALSVTKRFEETSGTNRKRSAGCVQKKHLTLRTWLSASREEDPCYSD
jgi:hypothetical protein